MKYVINNDEIVFQAKLKEQSEIIGTFQGKTADEFEWNPVNGYDHMRYLNVKGDELPWHMARPWCFVAPRYILYLDTDGTSDMRVNTLDIPYLWLEFKL